jgi:hypothetical protein
MVIQNRSDMYTLIAIVYYGGQHFTSQVITRDGRLWFYDGMQIADPFLSMLDPSIVVQTCRCAEVIVCVLPYMPKCEMFWIKKKSRGTRTCHACDGPQFK